MPKVFSITLLHISNYFYTYLINLITAYYLAFTTEGNAYIFPFCMGFYDVFWCWYGCFSTHVRIHSCAVSLSRLVVSAVLAKSKVISLISTDRVMLTEQQLRLLT